MLNFDIRVCCTHILRVQKSRIYHFPCFSVKIPLKFQVILRILILVHFKYKYKSKEKILKKGCSTVHVIVCFLALLKNFKIVSYGSFAPTHRNIHIINLVHTYIHVFARSYQNRKHMSKSCSVQL